LTTSLFIVVVKSSWLEISWANAQWIKSHSKAGVPTFSSMWPSW